MRKQIIYPIILIVAISCGCSNPNKIINKYYLLEKPDTLQFSAFTNNPYLDGYCEISPVHIYPAFSTQNIANRSNNREIVYYSYHFWAHRPDESFTLLIEDYYSHSAVFKGVSTRYWRLNPHYRLSTIIYQLELVEQGNSTSAHISLEFRLSRISDKTSLIIHRADKSQILEIKDLNLFAATVGELFYKELNTFSEKIMNYAAK